MVRSAPVTLSGSKANACFGIRRSLALLGLAVCAAGANAGPSGEQVAAGLAEFSRHGGNLTVNQISDKAIINWQDFSISQGNFARFVQPGSGSAVLNRVTSGNPSEIFGELSANGRVFLINQNGILVGKTGVIDTQGFVGSTLDLSNEAFMAGGDLDFSGGGLGAIRNLGQIRGLGGDVFLIAPQVENQGLVQAGGTAGIAAGAQVLLRESGSQRLWVGAAPAAAGGNGIDNAGLVQATQAELQAAGGNVYALSINNTGAVRATTVSNEGGRILLRAGSGGTVVSSGLLDASSETGQGGRIEVTGRQVGLMGDAVVDASGRKGGGEVLIGGDFQGGNAAVPNAERTYVGAGVAIRADGLVSGDGGKVIVWADDITRYYGDISARGGSAAGDGGFVEVSGKGHLSFAGHVDAGASQGRAGSLLLDPKNITISNAGVAVLLDNDAFDENPGDDVTIAPASITAITNAGTNVTLQANNDISVNSSIITNNPDPGVNGGRGGNMTFQAGRSIAISANITSDSGDITLVANDPNADPDHRDAGAAIFHNDGQIHAGSGTVRITLDEGIEGADPASRATGDLMTGNVNGASLEVVHRGFSNGGVVDLGATTLTGNLTVGSGDRDVVNSSGAITVLGVASFDLGTGDITVTGLNTDFDFVRFDSVNNVTISDVNAIRVGSGAASNIAGDLTITSRGPIGTGGAVIVDGATFLTANNGGFGTSTSDITVNNAGNDFKGLVTVTAGGGVTLTDSNDLALTDLISGGSINLDTSGDITSTGKITLPGGFIFTIDASAGGDVTLVDPENSFMRLVIQSGRDVELVSSDPVSLVGISNVSGSLELTADGTIRNESPFSGSITVTGDSIFRVTAANSDLLLGGTGNANNFAGSVSMLAGGAGSYRDVSFRNINALASVISGFPATLRNAAFTFDNAPSLDLPGMTLTGTGMDIGDGSGSQTLNVKVFNGNLVQSGPIVLTQPNASSRFQAGPGTDITLDNPGNDFKRVWIPQANNVSLRDSSGLTIDRIVTTGATGDGNVTIVADGAVDLLNWIQAKGLASFDVGNTNNVTLNNLFSNQVAGLQFVSVNNASYQGANGLYLAESDVSGTLSLYSSNSGALTQTGSVTTGGTTTFRNFGGGITLTDADNAFGSIAITDFGTSSTVSIRENDPITQSGAWNLNNGTLNLETSNNQAITLTNANEFQFVNVTQHDNGGPAGAVSIRNAHLAHGIRQTAPWTTAGTTTLNAGGNPVVLSNNDNVLGDLIVTNASAVTIVEDDDITQGAAWSLDGIAISLTARNGHDIVLDRAANLFGDLTLSGRDVTVVENGAITQGGAWTSTGKTTLTAGSNDITLDNNSNAFSVVEIVSAGEAILYDQDALVIDGANADGRLTVSVGGHLTQTGAIAADSLRLIGTGHATLEDEDNDVVSLAAAFSGGPLSYSDTDDFTIAILGESPGILIGGNAVKLVSHNGTVGGLALVSQLTTSLDVAGLALEIPAMNIAGPQTYTAANGITVTNNLVSSAAGAISFNGPVTLANNVSINTVNSDVSFNGTLDGDEHTLTISAGSGGRTFEGAVSDLGTSAGGVALLLNGSGTAEFKSTLAANNGIISGGPVIFRDDVTLGNGNIGSNFNGLVTLAKAGGMMFSGYDTLVFDGGALLEDGPASIISNDSQLTLGGQVSGPYALTLDAGNSNIVGLANLQPDLTGLSVTAFSLVLPSGLSIDGPQSFTLTNVNGAIELGGTLTSTAAGDIEFHSPVLLTAGSTVGSTDSAIVFHGAVNGAHNLTLSSGDGTKRFGAQVGGQTPIGSGVGAAIVLQGNGETLFDDTLRTASGIASQGPVTFTADVTLGNGDTGSSFGGLVTAGDLTIDGYDGIAFDGGLSLVDGPLEVISNGSTISFGGTVSGAQDLVLTALADEAGTVTGLQHVATDLTALTVLAHALALPQEGVAVSGPMSFTAAGGITLNGDVGNGDTGKIDFIGPVTLATQAVAVTSGDADITFTSTVTGAQNLTVDAGAGAKTFDGAVDFGSGTGHALVLKGSGGNTFEDEVTLASGILVEDGGDVTFRADVTLADGDTGSGFGTGLLTIGRAGAAVTLSGYDSLAFGGDLVLLGDAVTIDSNGSDIVFSGGVRVDATADTTFNGDIVLQGGLTIDVDTSTLEVNGGIDGDHAFVIDSDGRVAIVGDIGLNQRLASVSIGANELSVEEVRTNGTQTYAAPAGITLSGDLDTVSADVSFTGPVVLTADVTISTNAGGGDVSFIGAGSTIDGNHQLLIHALGGNVALGGAVGDTTPLSRILATGHDLSVGRITVDGDDSLFANNDLTVTQSRTYTESTHFIADADGDGDGSFILLDGVELTPAAGTQFLIVSAADIDMQGSSSINAGDTLIGIDSTAVNGITLGADGVGSMNISASELSRIHTGRGLILRAFNSGDININTAFGSGDILIGLQGANILQTQPLQAAELFLLAEGGAIGLDHAGNLFGPVVIDGDPTSVSLRNSADITQWEGEPWLLEGVDVTLHAGGHDIILTAAGNRFGILSLTGRDATVVSAVALGLGAGALTGSLDADADGAITVTGALDVEGDLALTANGLISQSAPITVGGDVSLTTRHAAGDVELKNDGHTQLGDSLIGGDFKLDSSGGDVTQALGTSLTVAGTFDPTGSGNVILDNAGNIVNGYTPVAGTNVIQQVGVITLDGTDIGEVDNLIVISKASEIGFGGQVVAGDAIVLTDAGNSFGGTVSITTDAPVIVPNAPDEQTGIQQTPGTALTVTGQASFTAEDSTVPGSGFIHLTNEGNSFGSLVLKGTDVQVNQDAGEMVIDSANASEYLQLLSKDGGITQTGAIVTPDLVVGRAAGSLILDHAGNSIGRVLADVFSGDMVLHTLGSLELTLIDVHDGSLTLISGGDITQSGVIFRAGRTTLTAAGGIDLSLANSIESLGDVSAAGDIEIFNADDGLAIDGDLVTTDGTITVRTAGDLTIEDGRTITVNGSGDVVLSATGDFINHNDGATISLEDGRFLIYTTDVDGVRKGGLSGGALFSRNYADNAPGSITHEGNLFIYSFTPVLTFRPDSISVVYGEAPALTYNVTGLIEGHTAGMAYDGDPALTTDAVAGSNVGIYLIDIAQGGLTLTDLGYGVAFEDDGAAVTVDPRTIDLSGDRTYDATTALAAGIFTLGNLFGGETLTLTGTGSMADRHAGNGKAVTLGSLALGDGTNGGLAGNYTLAGGTHLVDITPAALTISTGDVVKVYDGTTNAIGAAAALTAGALFGGDTISGGAFAYANANAGIGNKVVTVGGVTVNDGNGGGNYAVTYADNTTSTISPYVVDLSGSRVYDGTAALAAGIFSLGALVGDETLTLSGAGTMANRHAGNGKVVTPGSLALGDGTNGGLAGNYTLVGGTHRVDITPAALTVTTGDVVKTYDGTTSAAGSAVITAGGLFGGDVIGSSSFAYANRNAGIGNKVVTVNVTVNDGNGGNNYAVNSVANTTSTINPYVIDLSGSRVYDGTAALAAGLFSLGTLVGNETLTLGGTGTMADRDAGNGKAVTLGSLALGNGTNGGLAGNYTLAGGTHLVDITPAALTITIHDQARSYGAANPELTFQAQGLVSGDTEQDVGLAFNIGTTAHSGSAVGSYAITGTGSIDGGNYALVFENGLLTVNPAVLSVIVANTTRTFGNRDAIYLVTVGGFVNGDTSGMLQGQLQVDDTTALFAPAGLYQDALMPHGVSAANYTIDFVAGTLTITGSGSVAEPPGVDRAVVFGVLQRNERRGGVTPLYTYDSVLPMHGRTGGYSFGAAANDEPAGMLAYASSFPRP